MNNKSSQSNTVSIYLLSIFISNFKLCHLTMVSKILLTQRYELVGCLIKRNRVVTKLLSKELLCTLKMCCKMFPFVSCISTQEFKSKFKSFEIKTTVFGFISEL